MASTPGTSLAKHNYQLIKQFKRLIESRRKSLMAKFELADRDGDGTLPIEVWARLVARELDDEISPEHLVTLKDYLCECESNLGVVNYATMFGSFKATSEDPMDRNYLDIINNLFQILDKNGDKRISVSEAQEALERINQRIGHVYSIQDDCVNFIKNMDRNGDNFIDLDEFRRAFFEDLDDSNPSTNNASSSSSSAAVSSFSSSSNQNELKHKHKPSDLDDENVNSDDSEEGDLQIVRI